MLHMDPEKTSSTQPYYRVGRMLRKMGYPVGPGTTVRYVWVDKNKVVPVVGRRIPRIRPGGYARYWERVVKLMYEVFGPQISRKNSLDAWLRG